MVTIPVLGWGILTLFSPLDFVKSLIITLGTCGIAWLFVCLSMKYYMKSISIWHAKDSIDRLYCNRGLDLFKRIL